MSALNPIDNPEAWDVFYVGNNVSPGACQITGASLENEWDVKRGKGVRGATVTYTGDVPSKFKIKLIFWTSAHFAAWDAFRPLLKYDPTKKTIQAIDILHPALSDLDISSVVTNDIGQIEREGDSGKYSVTLSMLQFRIPGKSSAIGTPTNSQTTTGGTNPAGNQPPTAVDAQQAEIARLLKIAQEP